MTLLGLGKCDDDVGSFSRRDYTLNFSYIILIGACSRRGCGCLGDLYALIGSSRDYNITV